MKEKLIVISLNEISDRWQIPVERIQYFITELNMPVDDEGRGKWFAEHSELILSEQQKAFDDLLFPRPFRPEPAEPSS